MLTWFSCGGGISARPDIIIAALRLIITVCFDMKNGLSGPFHKIKIGEIDGSKSYNLGSATVAFNLVEDSAIIKEFRLNSVPCS
ncbi:hypothetical protein NIES2101_30835 [Calothrix sp. HK-06]|nr:hypothetical protein NIES2101_30835 [Calothrix sp. HK-06]